jgi:hypothetical protein
MGKLAKALAFIGMLVLAVGNAAPQARGAEGAQGTIEIVFKDGHHQTIRLADVARIEFNTSNASAPTPKMSATDFLGEWKVGVGDGTERTFFITLKPNGVAHKTSGSPSGTWTVVNGEARITWEDGWRDAIRKVGRRYEKAAFSPGHTFSDKPHNVTSATYTEAH